MPLKDMMLVNAADGEGFHKLLNKAEQGYRIVSTGTVTISVMKRHTEGNDELTVGLCECERESVSTVRREMHEICTLAAQERLFFPGETLLS